jgi:hypothetical protein
VPGASEGLVTSLTITTQVFEIARRYRSMEGPYAEFAVPLGTGSDAGGVRELWWWKGARIEVLDEQGRTIGQEFMCHLNIDVDPEARKRELGAKESVPRRLLTLTQGETEFGLPRGVALPVSSDETWSFMFQVLNHNRDGVFRVKQRLTLYFVRDVDLFAPMDPVTWFAVSLWVPLEKLGPLEQRRDEAACHCCAPLVRGLEATNNIANARMVDDHGRTFVAHWTVPPGKSTWSYPLTRVAAFHPKGDTLHAMWTHVHPFATEARLIAHEPGCAPRVVSRSSIESLRDGRVGLVKIRSLSSEKGVSLPEADYEMAVDYDNSSDHPQDSMTTLGMFVSDMGWSRPAWASRAQNSTGLDASCGGSP